MAKGGACGCAAIFFITSIILGAHVLLASAFSLEEATIADIQAAFRAGQLTSYLLVRSYLHRIASLNPLLNAVIEINPQALRDARRADSQRSLRGGFIGGIHGIPVLLKDNIATLDQLNTTAGSFALLGCKVPRDAGVVARLRKAGAIILGKANLSQWANYRSSNSSNGWSSRGGQTKNPYVLSDDPSGSSSGSAVAAAANLVAVTLGSETSGSILAPSSKNAVVGIKPSVGLTSRAGVIPISHHQDTIGPLCRTVADAVAVLEVIVGYDKLDNATWSTSGFIPKLGYQQFLKADGLHGKRVGVLRNFFSQIPASEAYAIEKHLQTMRELGGDVIDNVRISTISDVSYEKIVLNYDFKQDLNDYLSKLVESPVRSLKEVIQFNIKHASEEELNVYDQDRFYKSEATTGFQSKIYRNAVKMEKLLTKKGIDKVMETNKLDAVIAPTMSSILPVAAIAGYPGIGVPAGYTNGVPFGIVFVGKKGSEPILIQIAYAFEQATRLRKPPSFCP